MEVSSLFPPSGSQRSNYVIRLDDRHLYTLSLAPKTDFLELFTFLVAVTLSNKSGVGKDVYISSQHEEYSPSWQAGHGDRRVRWRVKLPYAARKQRERNAHFLLLCFNSVWDHSQWDNALGCKVGRSLQLNLSGDLL